MRRIVLLIILILGISLSIEEAFSYREIKFKNEKSILKSEELFKIKNNLNMQGLAYGDNKFYVGFDMKNGNGMIEVYSEKGELIKQSKLLKIGHCAELSYNESNGYLYAVNGSGKTKTKIYEIDIDGDMTIKGVIDCSNLGNSGLIVALNDGFMVHTAVSDKESHIFSKVDMAGNLQRQIKIKNIGVPQGIEYDNGYIYFYTNNKISIISFSNGEVIKEYIINEKGESEGMTWVKDKSYMVYGYNKKNRIYKTEIK